MGICFGCTGVIPHPRSSCYSNDITNGKRGIKGGIITGAGIAVGDLLHTIAAVLGLSAILMTSALAFELVKYLGAAYLIYLELKHCLKKQKGRTSQMRRG